MNKLDNYKFNPEIDHLSVEQYGLMAKPTDSPVKYDKGGRFLKIAAIPKENLGIGRYQRSKINHKRIKSIHQDWHGELGNANVCELYHEGKYYYQLVDGQHRSCASPYDTMDCIITNTHVPVDNFLMANNPKTTKPITDDDAYWAKFVRWETVDDEISINDPEDIKYIHTLFVNNGWTPSRKTTKRDADFGSNISKLHGVYSKQVVKIVNKLVKSKKITEDEGKNLRRAVLTDCIKIMIDLFGFNTFKSHEKYLNCWGALMKFLCVFKEFEYNVQEVLSTLKQGRWCKYAKGRESDDRLETILDWRTATYKYISSSVKKTGLKIQDADAWYLTFIDVYKVSSR